MDKNAIKKFAIQARVEMIARVSQKAEQYGITERSCGEPHAESINGRLLSRAERDQRRALIGRIAQIGYRQVMEEVSYTWFNRFIALRFMEVNGYLPTRIRVFTDVSNAFKPQILAEAIHMELDGLDMERVFAYKQADETEELYKYLLITQCNALSTILPGLFQRIEDYTELLLPDHLLREGSVIEQMVTLIPEADWQNEVQIIGWLYQYYNTEPKNKVFENLKKNIKISKESIPAATQLFTPDWIVRYMVENSLGRLWLEGHPDAELQASWRYYLPEAEQEPQVEAELLRIREGYKALTPEAIRCIDPCMGSGHILVYMFDVLMQVYQRYGYTPREAAASIVENNLYGLDIDDRAAQLAYFAVMMKARAYDRRFFSRGKQPHVLTIQESNGISREQVALLGNGMSELERNDARTQMNALLDALKDAKEYGSILVIEPFNWSLLRRYVAAGEANTQVSMESAGMEETCDRLITLIEVGEALSSKYDVVVTNPPYMGSSGMGGKLAAFVKTSYPDSKSDLFAVMMERCGRLTKTDGFQAMITQHAWMFLSSFEKLRKKLQARNMVNMAHLGARAFDEIGGEVVQTTSFVLRNSSMKNWKGKYCRLIEPTTQQGKEEMFLAGENCYTAKQDDFSKIPGSPVAYWISKKMLEAFSGKRVSDVADTCMGMTTGDNNKFLRQWFEVSCEKICLTAQNNTEAQMSKAKWFPYHKGGEFRRWYGNNDYIVNWESNGKELKKFSGSTIRNVPYYFRQAITWSLITTSLISFRYRPHGFVFGDAGPAVFPKTIDFNLMLGLLNSKVIQSASAIINPTINSSSGVIADFPVIDEIQNQDDVIQMVSQCVNVSKSDWDSFETSWDFQVHPLVAWSRNLRDGTSVAAAMHKFYGKLIDVSCPVELCFLLWQGMCNERFARLKANEEELNRIFIDIYGLQDELSPDVDDKDVTVRKADLGRDIRSFISYAVGCMLGRYSLDKPGLAYAGGEWDESKYVTFPADMDGILPISDDEYFEDDIVNRFVRFVLEVFGEPTLEANLRYIASALGGKGSPKEVIRAYFLNDFFADHIKIYQKRPIYWLFDSGKKNGFKCLIYMHRYTPTTIARIRTDYVHEQQSRYRTAIADLENRLVSAAAAERVRLQKQLTKLQAQAEEARLYEEKIHHLADQMIAIDLDDGVKVNYAKFADVLAKIK